VLIDYRGLLLLHAVGLFEQVARHDLDYVNNIVILVDLLELVEVVKEGVLGLIYAEDI